MAEVIYKYDLEINDVQELQMPEDSSIIAINVQHGIPRIWAIANPDARLVKRTFEMYGTGQTLKGPAEDGKFRTYLESFQMLSGNLVYHLFEIKR